MSVCSTLCRNVLICIHTYVCTKHILAVIHICTYRVIESTDGMANIFKIEYLEEGDHSSDEDFSPGHLIIDTEESDTEFMGSKKEPCKYLRASGCYVYLIYISTSVFDKLIWRTIGPKSFLFGTVQFSL